jgi:Concanavalin A-like lectin/glucanases superfamily
MRIALILLAGMLSARGVSQRNVSEHQDFNLQTKTSAEAARGAEIPAGSVFSPPAANACQSKYDQFYVAEPGVYAYWALCETDKPIQVYDYVGQFDLTAASHTFGSGGVVGGVPGPVPDSETAASVPTANLNIENQGIPLNTHQGTVSAWINADAPRYPVTALFLGAVAGKSQVSIGINATAGLCFGGNYTNAEGTVHAIQKCGYTPNSWHRVVFTWSAGELSLYVDGTAVAKGQYAGSLDNKVFYYRLFPACCNTGKQMTLAKVLVSNQAWNSTQVTTDFAPVFPEIPLGGVYVSSQRLGTIHRNILGYADFGHEDTSTYEWRTPLLAGLAKGGFTSVRYGGGYGGIEADFEDWRGRGTCTKTRGVQGKTQITSTEGNIDGYLKNVAQPLGLNIIYTVNYGTNPPECDQGGDPIVNGADLVEYANLVKKFGIKYWEIGNEVYSGNSETDFHPQPNTGASYLSYEPAFYTAMKAKDPSIKIAVPIGGSIYSYQAGFDLPVLAGASYDAVVLHNYPMKDPISDGATLYRDRVAANLSRTRGTILKLQTELLNNGKSADSIWATEWSGCVGGNKCSKQTMGAVTPLFVVSQLAEYMLAGVQLATWWTQGSLSVCSSLNYDGSAESAYNWWNCNSTGLVYTEPAKGGGEVSVGLLPGELTPAARGFQVLSESQFVIEGEHMLLTQTDVQNAPWLQSYAATHGRSYALILINRDRDKTQTVPVRLAGKSSGGSVRQWTYGRAQYDKSRFGDWSAEPVVSNHGPWTGNFQASLPPWSVNVFVFGN